MNNLFFYFNYDHNDVKVTDGIHSYWYFGGKDHHHVQGDYHDANGIYEYDDGNYDYERGKPLPVLPVAACLPLARADLGL